MDVRVELKLVGSLVLEVGLISLNDSSESSSVLLPLLESSQSITEATSSALKLYFGLHHQFIEAKEDKLTLCQRNSPIVDIFAPLAAALANG